MTEEYRSEGDIETELFDARYKLLTKEWELCDSNIGRFDNLLFVVRGWTVALATAIVGYAYSANDPTVCYLSIVPIMLFWSVDALFKSFQRHFILRSRAIEEYLASDVFERDFQNQRLTMKVPSMSTTFGSGSFGNRTSHFLSSGLLKNVMISYLPTIVLMLSVGIALQMSFLAPPVTPP